MTHLAWFADPEDLRYRIRRLQAPPARSARSALSLGLASAIMTGGLGQAQRTGCATAAGPDLGVSRGWDQARPRRQRPARTWGMPLLARQAALSSSTHIRRREWTGST